MAGENSLNRFKDAINIPRPEQKPATAHPDRPLAGMERAEQVGEQSATQEGRATAERVAPAAAQPAASLPTAIDPVLEARRKQIENILAENLLDAYQGLDAERQRKFKTVGEKTATDINLLLNEAKVKVHKIINLIKFWLSILPGMNKFFLEKEAKIKTDAIIQLKKGGEQ